MHDTMLTVTEVDRPELDNKDIKSVLGGRERKKDREREFSLAVKIFMCEARAFL